MVRIYVLSAFVALFGALELRVESITTDKQCKFDLSQLSSHVQPTHYKLEITPYSRKNFSGQVEIYLGRDQDISSDVSCSSEHSSLDQAQIASCERTKIILHADESINITEISFQELSNENDSTNGTEIAVKDVCRSTKSDILMIELLRELTTNKTGRLKIKYTGQIQDGLFTGITESIYQDKLTKKYKMVITTFLEPAYARKVLPCFDEPKYKATFELALEHSNKATALSNTEQLRQEKVEGTNRTKTYFARTPKMSTYLLAFVLGIFDKLESPPLGDDKQMTIRVYTPVGRSNEAKLALDVAVKGYLALREYINVSLPIKKIDFVTSGQFYPGAMENWGLITYREDALLSDIESSSSESLHFTIYSIIHELAHQWFGNLVTMKWWDNLWLKEGFASWLGSELADKLYPELDFKLMNLIHFTRSALVMDANQSECHPVKLDSQVQTLDKIKKSFDYLTYQKGSAIIKMLADFVGPENFKQGLRIYVRENQFKSTNDTDLWRALSRASQQLDIKEMMRSWIEQPGFPLISAKLAENNTRRLELSQARFGAPCNMNRTAWRDQKWVVPISLWVSDGKNKTQKVEFLLSKSRDELELPDWFDIDKAGHWLKLNADFDGFYRVRYDLPKLLAALRRPIEEKTMSPADRISFLEEATGLFKANHTSAEEFAELLTWFKNEDHPAVQIMISLVHLSEVLNIKYADDKRGLHDSAISYFNQNVARQSGDVHSASLVKKYARSCTTLQILEAGYEPAITIVQSLWRCCKDLSPNHAFEMSHKCRCSSNTTQAASNSSKPVILI